MFSFVDPYGIEEATNGESRNSQKYAQIKTLFIDPEIWES